MRKFIAILFAIAALRGGQLYAASTDTISIATPEEKTVEIHMTKKEPLPTEAQTKKRLAKPIPLPLSGGTCSGSFITDRGDIITAKHCVEGFDAWQVQTSDSRKYAAVVVATSTAHDLAIIHIDRRNTAYFRLADGVTRGEEITALGSPLAITDVMSQGHIARIDGDDLLLDCGVLPGNSGGPLYNNKGEMVGVVNAGYIVMLGVTHLNVAQGLDSISFFIEEFKKKNPK